MFNFFKKNKHQSKKNSSDKFINELELTAVVLAYEVARSDGKISKHELKMLLNEVKKIASMVDKTENKILDIIEVYSKNSTSFYQFVKDINSDFSKEQKLSLIRFLWEVAYADSILEVNEERLIRRVADLIHIKDIDVLKLKNQSKSKKI